MKYKSALYNDLQKYNKAKRLEKRLDKISDFAGIFIGTLFALYIIGHMLYAYINL